MPSSRSRAYTDILHAQFPDGTVRVVKTCCMWDVPDGPRCGMHVGGYKPFWISADGCPWLNLGSVNMRAVLHDWPVFAECARSLAEFLDTIGVEAIHTTATSGDPRDK